MKGMKLPPKNKAFWTGTELLPSSRAHMDAQTFVPVHCFATLFVIYIMYRSNIYTYIYLNMIRPFPYLLLRRNHKAKQPWGEFNNIKKKMWYDCQ